MLRWRWRSFAWSSWALCCLFAECTVWSQSEGYGLDGAHMQIAFRKFRRVFFSRMMRLFVQVCSKESHACRLLGNGASHSRHMAFSMAWFDMLWALPPVDSCQVIYFFAVFTVHYVGEMFRNDVLTSNLSSSMGEAMFTLPEAQFPRCIWAGKVWLSAQYRQYQMEQRYLVSILLGHLRFSFATLEDYTTTVRHFMRSGMSGVLVAVCTWSEWSKIPRTQVKEAHSLTELQTGTIDALSSFLIFDDFGSFLNKKHEGPCAGSLSCTAMQRVLRLCLLVVATMCYPASARNLKTLCLTHWYLFLGIVGFILFANLALLNLLTAIMVEAVVDILPLFLEESLWNQWRIWICPEHSLCDPVISFYLLQFFLAALQHICVNSKAKEKHLDGNFTVFDAIASHAFSGFLTEAVGLFNHTRCKPGSEVLNRETAARVKKLKELFHKMDSGLNFAWEIMRICRTSMNHLASIFWWLMAQSMILKTYLMLWLVWTCMLAAYGRFNSWKSLCFDPARKSMAAREWAAMNSRRM